MVMTIESYVGDSEVINVTVSEGGSPKDITGATLTARTRNPQTKAATDITATAIDPVNGAVQVVVPTATTDAEGLWLTDLEVALGSESKTVWSENINAKPANKID